MGIATEADGALSSQRMRAISTGSRNVGGWTVATPASWLSCVDDGRTYFSSRMNDCPAVAAGAVDAKTQRQPGAFAADHQRWQNVLPADRLDAALVPRFPRHAAARHADARPRFAPDTHGRQAARRPLRPDRMQVQRAPPS